MLNNYMLNVDNELIYRLIHEESAVSFGVITANDIERQIANIRHILFEVTDFCNLNCEYCGYGELYGNHDKRCSNNMKPETAKIFLSYILRYLNSDYNDSINYYVNISFYGGEPLLNMSFIKEIINYIESLKIKNIVFRYSMTTNALLLSRYMEYIVKKNFQVLISLDGNKYNNSYRVNKSGNESFNNVYSNIKELEEAYPNFFDKNVRFNTVLHNRNSVSEVYHFFKKEFNKVPSFSELNNCGIREDKKEEFWALYKSKQNSLASSIDYESIRDEMFFDSPETNTLSFFIHQYSGNVFREYSDLLYKSNNSTKLPTGTCFPFHKKIFLTVNRKILPCERIGHEYIMGCVVNDVVEMDFNSIAGRYNEWYGKLSGQCSKCFHLCSCTQCIFNIEGLDENPICKSFMDKKKFMDYTYSQMVYLSHKPELYRKIMEELIIE